MKQRCFSVDRKPFARPGELAIIFAILWVTACIVFPVFARAREFSGPSFSSYVRETGMALAMYAQDYADTLPPAGSRWDRALLAYAGGPPFCDERSQQRLLHPRPQEITPDVCRDLALNEAAYGKTLSTLRPNMVLVAETHYRYRKIAPWPWSPREYYAPLTLTGPDMGATDAAEGWKRLGEPAAIRRNGESVYGFADGHVKLLRPDQVYSLDHPGNRDDPGFAP